MRDLVYLYDLLWYVQQCETIEPLSVLEDVEQNPPIQLIGDLTEHSFGICNQYMKITLTEKGTIIPCQAAVTFDIRSNIFGATLQSFLICVCVRRVLNKSLEVDGRRSVMSALQQLFPELSFTTCVLALTVLL